MNDDALTVEHDSLIDVFMSLYDSSGIVACLVLVMLVLFF